MLNMNKYIFSLTFFNTILLFTNTAFAIDPPNVKVSPNSEVVAVANLEVKPGSESDFEKAANLSVKCSRLEPGNVSFSMFKVLDSDKPTYVMQEVWRSKEALQSHFVEPYTQALFTMFSRDLSAPPALHFIADLKPVFRSKHPQTNPKSSPECL